MAAAQLGIDFSHGVQTSARKISKFNVFTTGRYVILALNDSHLCVSLWRLTTLSWTLGLLLEKERILLEKEESYGRKGIWPLLVVDWLLHLVKKLNKEGRFQNSSDFFKHVELILTFKKSCGNTLKFASKNIPFALIQARFPQQHSLHLISCLSILYLQAVTITIYVFGLASLMARQFADKSRVTTLLTGYLPLLHPIQVNKSLDNVSI